MKLQEKYLKTILIIFLITVSCHLAINFEIYLDNQNFIQKILSENDIDKYKTESEVAQAITSITFNNIKNYTGNKSAFIYCGTPLNIYKDGGACGCKSLFTLSLLKEAGIEAHILGLTQGKNNYAFKHVIIEAKIGNRYIILDPSFNTSYNYSKEQLKSKTIFDEYIAKIKEDSNIVYPKLYNFTTYSYFNYNLFGPFKNIAFSFSKKLDSTLGYKIYQPYFIIRCDLRYIFISLFLMVLLSLILIKVYRI